MSEGFLMSKSMYPNAFYRVSVKALITNADGHVFVLKENQDEWSLPGGGLDHGEDPRAGLQREVKEELNLDVEVPLQPATVRTFHLSGKGAWLLWVVYKVTLPEGKKWQLGEGVTEAAFIAPESLDASSLFEKLVQDIAIKER